MPKTTGQTAPTPKSSRSEMINQAAQEIINQRYSAVNNTNKGATAPATPAATTPGVPDHTILPEQLRIELGRVRGDEATGTTPETPTVTEETPPPVTETPAATTTTPTVPEVDPFETATSKIDEIFKGRDKNVESVVEAIRGLGDLRTSAFDKLYGEDSRISQFFQPSLRAVEEQLLDTEELLTTLRTDIQQSQADTELSQAQFNRIEAKERGTLVDQFDKLTRARTRLQTGLDLELQMTDREFENTLQSAQDSIDALTFELEQNGLADETEISLIKQALQADLNEQAAMAAENRNIAAEARQEAAQIRLEDRATQTAKTKEREDAVRDILAQAQEFVVSAGVIPSANFNKVIQDAEAMAAAGRPLAEIQLGVLQAIGANTQVREFINAQFEAAKAKLNKASAPPKSSSSSSKTTTKDSGDDLIIAEIEALLNS